MKIKVNEKLKESILNNIPNNFSNLEKAIFVYHQLCLKLNYSMEYFLDEEKYMQKYSSLSYIESVNGLDVNEVVCFSFNAIFIQLLIYAGICDESCLVKNSIYSTLDNCVYPVHKQIQIDIDNKTYYIDATAGIIDKNDLTLSKYSTHKLTGWNIMYTINNDENNKQKEILNNAIETVQQHNNSLKELQDKYISLKTEDNLFEKISLEDRIAMFKNCVNSAPDYSLLSFNYLIKMKKKLFSKLEVGKEAFDKFNVELLFAKDMLDNEYKAYFFCNEKGYINEAGKENFDSLEIYCMSIKNRNISKISLEEFNDILENGKIKTNKNEPVSIYNLHMIREGFEK